MSRELTAAIQAETGAGRVEPFLLAELLFDGDPLRVWNGVGDLDWNGYTWTGVGHLGGVDAIKETADLKAEGVAFTLSGIPSAVIALALGANYHNRIARLYLGFFDGAGVDEANIVADPFVIREGLMDQMDIREEGETARITVRAESRLISLNRARELLYTHEDQQALFPGDRGFEFVEGLQDKEIAWGVGVGSLRGPSYARSTTRGSRR